MYVQWWCVHYCSPETWFRPVLQVGQNVVVHWGMYPDRWGYIDVHAHSDGTKCWPFTVLYVYGFLCWSYDSWLSVSDVDVDVEEAPPSERPWKVRLENLGCVTDLPQHMYKVVLSVEKGAICNTTVNGQKYVLWSWDVEGAPVSVHQFMCEWG